MEREYDFITDEDMEEDSFLFEYGQKCRSTISPAFLMYRINTIFPVVPKYIVLVSPLFFYIFLKSGNSHILSRHFQTKAPY